MIQKLVKFIKMNIYKILKMVIHPLMIFLIKIEFTTTNLINNSIYELSKHDSSINLRVALAFKINYKVIIKLCLK